MRRPLPADWLLTLPQHVRDWLRSLDARVESHDQQIASATGDLLGSEDIEDTTADVAADIAALQAADVTLDLRVDALEAADITLDGRLDTLEAINDVRVVATISALKSEATGTNYVRKVVEAHRNGFFAWRTGDYSTYVANDTREGVYVKATAVSAATGCWVRLGDWTSTGVRIAWFNMTGGNDGQLAINAALAFGEDYDVPVIDYAGQILCNSGITVPAGVVVKGDLLGRWKQANSANLGDFVTLLAGSHISGIVIDGNKANNTTAGGVMLRFGSDVVMEGCRVIDSIDHGVAINATANDTIVRNNDFEGCATTGVFIHGDLDSTGHLIENNRFSRVGWTGILIEEASGITARGNKVTGIVIGLSDNPLTIDSSGNTISWDSGPTFDDVIVGNFVVCDNGREFRVTAKGSNTSLTVANDSLGNPPGTLSGVAATIGSGDLFGCSEVSNSNFFDNEMEGSATFGYGMSNGANDSSGVVWRRNSARRCGKNGFNVLAPSTGGDLIDTTLADCSFIQCGDGGGIGTLDEMAIFFYGTSGGGNDRIDGFHISNITVDGGSYWLGFDGNQAAGSVTVSAPPSVVNVTNDGDIYGAATATASVDFGASRTAVVNHFDGRDVDVTITAAGGTYGSALSLTVAKIVECCPGLPRPKAFLVTSSVGIQHCYSEHNSTRGSWGTVLNVAAPVGGETYRVFFRG